jgi:hypothetical protein
MHKRVFYTFIILLTSAILLLGQGTNVPPSHPGPVPPKSQLSEVSRLRVLAAYQKAIIAQVGTQAAQQKMNEAVQEYQKAADEAVEENKLPKGTRLNVNVDTGEVTTIAPPPEPVKPEAKKP